MNQYRADLHIHSVLSPCGDLDMSPKNIVTKAVEKNLNLIAITDHNSTLHGPVVRKLAAEHGIYVLYGAEFTTNEEVHCVCLFDTEEQRVNFQSYIEESIQKIPNNVDYYGYQLVVDENEDVIDQVDYLLISTTTRSIYDVQAKVSELGGIFIPAHIDRPKFSITSQLGFVPPDLKFDALEVSRYSSPKAMLAANPFVSHKRFIRSSDAHFIDDIAKQTSLFMMEQLNFENVKNAINGINGCDVVVD